MSQSIICLKCKNVISVNPQSLTDSNNIQCQVCGAMIPRTEPPVLPGIASMASSASSESAGSLDSTARKKSSWWRLLLFAVGALLTILVLHFVINGYLVARKVIAVQAEERNMKRIALAISNYYDTYKRFPAPTTMDGRRPASAWTVSVLHYVDLEERPEARGSTPPLLSEAELQGPVPDVFRSVRGKAKPNERNVFVIKSTPADAKNNKATIFVEGQYAPNGAFESGFSKTVLAIQLSQYSRPWSEPVDLSIDEAYALIQKEPDVFLAITVDLSTRWIPSNISREEFESLVLRKDLRRTQRR